MIIYTTFKIVDDGSKLSKIYERLRDDLGLVKGNDFAKGMVSTVPSEFLTSERDDVLVYENPDNGNLGAYKINFSDRVSMNEFSSSSKVIEYDMVELSYWYSSKERMTKGVIEGNPMKDAIKIVKSVGGNDANIVGWRTCVVLKDDLTRKLYGK